MRELFKKYSAIFKFIGLALLLLIAWALISAFFPEWIYEMHYQLIRQQTIVSGWLLSAFYHVDMYFLQGNCLGAIRLEHMDSVCVGTGCSGLELFFIFAAFILIYQGNRRHMWWFLPVGLGAILVLNIIRITLLSVINHHYPQYLDFNHKYTFVLIVYGAIFALWLIWVNRLSISKKQPENDE